MRMTYILGLGNKVRQTTKGQMQIDLVNDAAKDDAAKDVNLVRKKKKKKKDPWKPISIQLLEKKVSIYMNVMKVKLVKDRHLT